MYCWKGCRQQSVAVDMLICDKNLHALPPGAAILAAGPSCVLQWGQHGTAPTSPQTATTQPHACTPTSFNVLLQDEMKRSQNNA